MLRKAMLVRRKKDWAAHMDVLCKDIQKWVSEERGKWSVQASGKKKIEQQEIGTYSLPRLTIKTPGGRIQLEPVGMDLFTGEGRVDFYASPSFRRLLLVDTGKGWKLRTDSGIEWPHKWSKNEFFEVVKAII